MTTQATLDRYVNREAFAGSLGQPEHDYHRERFERQLGGFLRGEEILGGLRKVTAARKGSLVVDFDRLLEFNLELAKHLIDQPGDFLSNANRVLEEMTGAPRVHLCVRGLDRTLKIREIRAGHVGKFIQTAGFVVDKSEDGFHIQDIDWVKDIHHLDGPLKVKSGRDASYSLRCVCSRAYDWRRGCADISLGNYVTVIGTLRAEKVGASTIFNKFLEANHVEASVKVEPKTWGGEVGMRYCRYCLIRTRHRRCPRCKSNNLVSYRRYVEWAVLCALAEFEPDEWQTPAGLYVLAGDCTSRQEFGHVLNGLERVGLVCVKRRWDGPRYYREPGALIEYHYGGRADG